MSVTWVSAPVGTNRPAVIVDQVQGDVVTAFRGRFYIPGYNVQAELSRFLGQGREGIVAISGVGRAGITFREDHVIDAEAAWAAGVPFIGTLSSTSPRGALAKCPHRALVDGVEDVPSVLGLEG
jgi:hypothetical protein